jgi:acetoin utilization protein AcuB
MQVRAIMHTDVVTATPDMSIAQVWRLMHDKHIRHVPVVSGKRLVGMVTDRDIRDAMPSPATTLSRGEIAYQMDTTKVETCMTKKVVTVNGDMDTEEAARLLLEGKFGCLPVVDGSTLMGVMTDIDFLRAFLESGKA